MSVAAQTNEIAAVSPSLEGDYTVNSVACKPAFQLLIEHLESYTPEAQEAITGVSPEIARQLTYEYANTKPALLLGALGMRYQNQGEAYRALYLLGSLTGNIGRTGGGVTSQLLPTNHQIGFNDFPIVCPNGFQGIKTKNVRQMDFYEQVVSGKPYPIKAFFKTAGNPVHNCPNRSRWIEEVFPQMDLIVDFDIWMTDTGEYADYVLPDCTSFERMEIISMAAYNHIVLQEPAIEPLGEAKDPSYLFRELSKRVGLGEYFDKTAEEWFGDTHPIEVPHDRQYSTPIDNGTLEERETRARRRPRNTVRSLCMPPIPPLLQGEVEFYAEQLADMGEAMAVYRPALEIGNPKKEKEYPYQFFSGDSVSSCSRCSPMTPGWLSSPRETFCAHEPVGC